MACIPMSICVVIAAWYASGNPALKSAIDQFIRKINRATTPSGAPVGDEFAGGRAGDATSTGYEFCSLHELMAGWISLLTKSGEAGYGDRAERYFSMRRLAPLILKQVLSATSKPTTPIYSPVENTVTPLINTRPGTYSPVHREAAVCCVPNAGRIGPWYIQHMWMKDDEGILATLLGPSELNTTVKNQKVSIESITGYPFDFDFPFQNKNHGRKSIFNQDPETGMGRGSIYLSAL